MHLLKRGDVYLISIILIIQLIFNVFIYNPSTNDILASIYVNGEYIESIDVDVEYNEIDMNTSHGYNKLVISNGAVFIAESDCINEQCVSKGTINSINNMIICLPNKLVVRLESSTNEQ